MDPTFYVLAILPSLLWGFSPILSKRALSDGGDFLQAAFVLVSVCGTIYWVVLLSTHSPYDLFDGYSPFVMGIFFLGGIVGTTLGRVTAFTGVEKVGASMANTVISTRPLFSGALAILLLGESITWRMGVGIVAVVVGLMAVSRAKGGDLEGWSTGDLVYPLIAAMAFGGGNVLRRWGLSISGISALEAVALNEVGAMVALLPFVLTVRRKQMARAPTKSWWLFVAHGVLTAMALISMFEALRWGPVVIVDPFASLAPLFTVFFSHLFLKDLESVSRGIVLGAVLVFVGVVLISVG
jgi:DME family drug/metabolite transporter